MHYAIKIGSHSNNYSSTLGSKVQVEFLSSMFLSNEHSRSHIARKLEVLYFFIRCNPYKSKLIHAIYVYVNLS
jgi:hypothetical protein